ncbi:glycosyl transferase family 2 [Lactobacillus brevis] [Lactiplantibacillus mudanjiangensis]|uniref:glycosyltransferase n=1 Tax=Lactiplantibacillus mudanjiangensis TaxID=1296538 RepID=UPI001015404E|nr:glycosyltransferase [Lactiplantibacillus mudanjiangensis]VDG32744.1 glycosyl transferase family 2 [Lactobacillus brevis] [Lactiplantibacillus mudanjiangensis]
MKFANVSVLMSVYNLESPKNFREALNSMINQTYIPRQFVIVRDGELGRDLDKVLNDFFEEFKDFVNITIVKLNQQVSLGNALNAGLLVCEYPLIARMDSDDHAISNRIELQTLFFQQEKKVKVLGAQIQEFTDTWEHPNGSRNVPIHSDQIKRFSKTRNPLNHMTVMFRRDFIKKEMHGYRDIVGFEDYDLWLRVLKRQSDGVANLPQILVAARTSSLQKRRGGVKYVRQNAIARWSFYRDKLISFRHFIITLSVGTIVGLSSSRFRMFLYKKVLRKNQLY